MGLSECQVGSTANTLEGELVGAKRLLEASGLGYFRVSGYLDHYGVFSSGKFSTESPTTKSIYFSSIHIPVKQAHCVIHMVADIPELFTGFSDCTERCKVAMNLSTRT